MDRNRVQLAHDLDRTRHHLARQVVAEPQPRGHGPTRHSDVRTRREAVAAYVCHLAQAVATDEPVLLHEHVRWSVRYSTARSLALEPWRDDLHRLSAVLAEMLDAEAFALVQPYLVGLTEAEPAGAAEAMGELARRYLGALLRGDRDAAAAMIHQALADGADVATLYLDVFQRTQREVGRQWELNRLSVAEEHFCTAATRGIMADLSPQVFSQTRPAGRTFLAASIGQNLHELGPRMVADFFEMAGWRTHYLGANLTPSQLLEAIRVHDADVLGLSASMSQHLRPLAEAIRCLRAVPSVQNVKLLVGGHPFDLAPDLWRTIDADGYARDAREAVSVAELLMHTVAPPPDCETHAPDREMAV